MNSFLLEILVQELPYKFIPSAIEQLKKGFEQLLNENEIEFENVETYATPRRLVVFINNFSDKQNDCEKILKGPILKIARNENGTLTPAGMGFMNKNNATESDLYEENNYIWAKIQQKGVSSKEILQKNIENVILKLQGAHFMRWGALETRFSRPIENVVALYNNELLDIQIIDKKSTKTTIGHRFCPNNKIEINSPQTYFEQLKKVNVLVNQTERKQAIVELASKKAAEIDAIIDFKNNEELLDEITYITEFPVPVLCEFNKKYLEIPDIVTTTVMSKHQRYFPLFKNGKLLNYFITMANFVGEVGFDNIQNGNQRVVTARLEDGIFFYNEDTKTPLISKFENLKGITFQKGLGTLYNKTLRIEKIAQEICTELGYENENILKTARLSKIDLCTNLVFEFTELQGYIGANYALKCGENENVSKGIFEHYFPLNATSELAQGIEGQVVGIADKIDTICAIFLSTQGANKKKRPTGSNDPLGVRRAVLGVLRTILNCNLNLDLEKLIKFTLILISNEFKIEIEPEVQSEISDFFINRLVIMLQTDYSKEILEACASTNSFSALQNLSAYIKKVEFLTDIVSTEGFSGICENMVRVIRILSNEKNQYPISPKLFINDEEKALYEYISSGNLENFEQLSALAKKIEEFFNTSLVMDKDINIKNNRIALLQLIKGKLELICDFSKITI